MPEGLFIIRAVLGAFLFAHGTQKLFGWYGGYGPSGTGEFFESVGHRPGRPMAVVAGLSQAIGGTPLVLGFLMPLGAAMIIGTMVVASVSVHAPNGPWATNGGYELPMTNAVVAAGLAFTGAGGWSVDQAAGIPGTRGWGSGLLACSLALVAAGVVLARRNTIVAETEAEAYPQEEEAPPDQGATRSEDILNA